MLLIAVLVLLAIVFALSRWLTLISIGRAFSNARGLNPSSANTILLVIVALLCAFSTATVGPVSFVGLVAPHGDDARSKKGQRTIIRWQFDWCNAYGLGGLVRANRHLPEPNCSWYVSRDYRYLLLVPDAQKQVPIAWRKDKRKKPALWEFTPKQRVSLMRVS